VIFNDDNVEKLVRRIRTDDQTKNAGGEDVEEITRMENLYGQV
jgi:hypothetical protein